MKLVAAFALMAGLLCTAASAHAQGDPVRAFDPATAVIRKPGTTVRVDLVGDSTQTEHAGYGRGFCANFTAKVDCLDMARGGASTHTFRELGLWDRVLATKPDYIVIQFGHNDMVTKEHLDRQTPLPQYVENLRRFVTEARAAGIKPVLVSPLIRRSFGADGKIHSDLMEYAEALHSVATSMKVPYIDLHGESMAYLDKVGEDVARTYAIAKKSADGKTTFDNTHLNWAGSYVFGRMVAVDLGKVIPELHKYVLPNAAPLPPEGVRDMAILRGAPATIVLVGDSTVATEGGWGPGLCAVMTPNITCIDDAINGRSTKSYIDEGAWAKALARHGDYYLFQFGHNDQKPDPARHTDPETTFAANMRRFIRDVRAQGGKPILVSPLARRTFKDGKPSNDDLALFAHADQRVAEEEYVPYIDLLAMSNALLAKMTQEEADGFDAVAHADATAENGKAAPLDRTHLNAKGQQVFGRIVAGQISRSYIELGTNVLGTPVAAPAAKP